MEENKGENMLRIEAEDAMKDVRYAVTSADLSKSLPSTGQLVYFNMTTQENERYCVELSVQGFRIVGREFDRIQDAEHFSQFYETIYALLDNISPQYQQSFGNALMSKLAQLQQQQGEDQQT